MMELRGLIKRRVVNDLYGVFRTNMFRQVYEQDLNWNRLDHLAQLGWANKVVVTN